MIRVLLAEDMNMVRGALVALLSMEPDIEVVSEVDHGDRVVSTALECRPDIAVLDIDLPGTDGLSAATSLHELLPSCGTLILTSLGRPGLLQRALAARVSGFLLKDAPPEQLASAIRKVSAGERVVDPELVLAAWDHAQNPLTNRETEVLRLAAQGAEVGEIASTLFLSAGTVRNYLSTIVTKLNARNRVDAIRIAQAAGWLP
ncbi:response regulator transcription factor [Actinacidiphila guanduensis]|jgi:two-component system response regulator DesR|uniref:Two component transcriptional regulator, LuxR family n=1 Tax=Actinacidiphila guanduensis TaxID=310781 RepID=A0A1H0J2N8_9ACTN|nr:response regulator transcription factor [Actinacidiphila guanduensis]SDO37621.1 two component transcriptional regulator, LuxR family [Actinacidiphila guanduensis]